MKFFVLILTLYSSNLFACKFTPDDASDSPGTARTAIIGKVVNEKDSRFFEFFHNGKTKKLQLSDELCAGLNAKEGKYLLLSNSFKEDLVYLLDFPIYRTNNDPVAVENLNRGNGDLIPLVEVKKIIAELVKRETVERNVFWSFCTENMECKKVKNNCGVFIGINKQYQTNFDSFEEKHKKNAICPEKKGNSGKSICVENFCS